MNATAAARTIAKLDAQLDSGRHLTPKQERLYNEATTVIFNASR